MGEYKVINAETDPRKELTADTKIQETYDKNYYQNYSGPAPYRWSEPYWLNFFDHIV